MTRLAFVLPLLAVLLTAACNDDEPAAATPTPPVAFATVTATPLPTPTATPGPRQLLEARVLQRVAQVVDQVPEALVLLSLEEIDWPDHCLGIARPNALCQPGPVPGYRVKVGVLRETLTWELHTDESLDEIAWLAQTEDKGRIIDVQDGLFVIAGDSQLFTDTISPGEISVRIQTGTDFRTPRDELQVGSAVAFGIAGQPSSDVSALVWIEAR